MQVHECNESVIPRVPLSAHKVIVFSLYRSHGIIARGNAD
jgi:hypothetical protein